MKYKYLVTNGCSQTYGQNCHINYTWPKLLADRLGLELINLATPGTGWYKVETSTMSFIHNNLDIIDSCFFILQKSMLERRVNYQELALNRTDIWEKWNIEFLSSVDIATHGANNFSKFDYPYEKISEKDLLDQTLGLYDSLDKFIEMNQLNFFPEHKHYPDNRHHWKIDGKIPKYIYGQFEELMLHWATRMTSFSLLLNSIGADHIMVDGYTPFLSYKLNFENYYDTDDEFEMVKEFWSNRRSIHDVDENEMIYDFKNIKAGRLFDKINIKNKIDDVVLWSLYQFKDHETEWNIDGGHAGCAGMKLIESTIYKNLIKKGWFS